MCASEVLRGEHHLGLELGASAARSPTLCSTAVVDPLKLMPGYASTVPAGPSEAGRGARLLRTFRAGRET